MAGELMKTLQRLRYLDIINTPETRLGGPRCKKPLTEVCTVWSTTPFFSPKKKSCQNSTVTPDYLCQWNILQVKGIIKYYQHAGMYFSTQDSNLGLKLQLYHKRTIALFCLCQLMISHTRQPSSLCHFKKCAVFLASRICFSFLLLERCFV